jgi:2-polyprenyl-3-methyl-5-hydroxy-6-metoxy-1,4-benzoquinol methylase
MPLSKYDIELDLKKQVGTSHAYLVEMTGSNKRVLDVGCDTGYLGEALTALGNKVWGFEISEDTARLARDRMVDCLVGDLETVELATVFEPRSFEVVIFGDVLEHLRDPLPVLRSVRALLSPGGSVLVSTPNVAHGDVRLALLSGQFRYNKLGILDETHTRFFTAESLVDFARDAGFVVADLRRTHADLFSTEIGVLEADQDPGLVERLRTDPEATTYQFVARLVPDDSTSLVTEQALRTDALRSQVSELQTRLTRGEADAAALAVQRSALTEQVEDLRRAHDEAVRQRDELLAERDRLRAQLGDRSIRKIGQRVKRRLSGSADV